MNKRIGFVAALLVAACGGSPPAPAVDASVILPDVGTVEDAGTAVTCAHVIPNPDPDLASPAYGTSNGRSFRDFTLNRCDGTPYTFYGPEYCDPNHRLTVVSIAAGWCGPCQAESAQLTDRVVSVYESRGVRVVQILVQDAGYNRPDADDCNAWVDTYGLTIPELLDPDQITNRYFPDNSLPSTLIIDNTGVIVWHENGAVDGLTTLTDAIDSFLN